MMRSAPASYATTWSKTLGRRELSSWSRSLRISDRDSFKGSVGKRRGAPRLRAAPRCIIGLYPVCESALGAARKGVARALVLREHLVHRRLARQGPLDRLLHRLIVVVVDLLVAVGLPVNEHAGEDAVIVGLVLRNDA